MQEYNSLPLRQLSADTGLPDFSSYSPATVLMFALSSVGCALALLPIFLPDNTVEESVEVYGFLRIILSISVISMCLLLVYYKRKAMQSGHWPGVNTDAIADDQIDADTCIRSWVLAQCLNKTNDKQAKYMLTTLMFFGSCSMVSSVLQTVVELQSPVIPDSVQISNCILDIISLISQMIFFYCFRSERLPNIRRLHYAIALFIGIKLCSWIPMTLEPLWDTKPNMTQNDVPNGVANRTLQFFDEFFETFHTEFHTIAVGVLFYIWHSIDKFTPPTRDAGHRPFSNLFNGAN